MAYVDIVFLQDWSWEEEGLDLFDLDYEEVVEYLSQWDYGEESEHSPEERAPWGTSDRVHRIEYGGNVYYLSINTGMGYVGLSREI